jgi:hypothetical protein
MSADLPVPAKPTNSGKSSRERAKDYQLEAIAQMSTMGTPAGTMAQITGLSEPYINRLMLEGRNQTFNDLRERYQRVNLRKTVGFQFEMGDLLPEAIQAYRDGLAAKDPRLRFEVAKEVVNRVVPDLNGGKKNGNDQSEIIQLVVNQPQIGETMASVARTLVSLHEAVSRQDPDAHIKLGTDALPVPESQLEVSGGEAQLTPTENPETDLLMEAVERGDD